MPTVDHESAMESGVSSNEGVLCNMNIRLVQFYEAINPQRFKMACHRLRQLTPAQKQQSFWVISAARPFPFFPQYIKVRREVLKRSTRGGTQLGSIYNNWVLPTLFDDEKRPVRTLQELLQLCNISEDDFRSLSVRYWEANRLEELRFPDAKPEDITTWGGLDLEHDQRTVQIEGAKDYRLRAMFRAASKGCSFIVVRDGGIFARGDKIKVRSMDSIKKSLDKIFMAMSMSEKREEGIAVPCLWRAVLLIAWVLGMLVVVSILAVKKLGGLELWTMEYFQAVVFMAISVPALVEFWSDEPSVIRNSLKGNRILWKNSQVMKYFGLKRADYAVMGLLSSRMWLVSEDTASYLLVGGHKGLDGDIAVTDTRSLRDIGVYVGRTMARREWESKNWEVLKSEEAAVKILKKEALSKRISGEIVNEEVR